MKMENAMSDPNPLATGPTKWRAEHCTTHHHGCDCHEWDHAELVGRLEADADDYREAISDMVGRLQKAEARAERLADALRTIADIAAGSRTVNSQPNIERIARDAMAAEGLRHE